MDGKTASRSSLEIRSAGMERLAMMDAETSRRQDGGLLRPFATVRRLHRLCLRVEILMKEIAPRLETPLV